MSAAMHHSQLAAIQAVKKEIKIYEDLYQELLFKQSGGLSQDEQRRAAKLKGIIQAYTHKAHTEQQAVLSIQAELEKATSQLLQWKKQAVMSGTCDTRHTCNHVDRRGNNPASARVATSMAVQEQRSCLQQRMDAALALNASLHHEIESISKCGSASQQHYTKLQQQLARLTEEAVGLQEMLDCVQASQQRASALAQQLLLHDEFEQLSLDAVLNGRPAAGVSASVASGMQYASTPQAVASQQQQQNCQEGKEQGNGDEEEEQAAAAAAAGRGGGTEEQQQLRQQTSSDGTRMYVDDFCRQLTDPYHQQRCITQQHDQQSLTTSAEDCQHAHELQSHHNMKTDQQGRSSTASAAQYAAGQLTAAVLPPLGHLKMLQLQHAIPAGNLHAGKPVSHV